MAVRQGRRQKRVLAGRKMKSLCWMKDEGLHLETSLSLLNPRVQAPTTDLRADDLANYFKEKIDHIRQEIISQSLHTMHCPPSPTASSSLSDFEPVTEEVIRLLATFRPTTCTSDPIPSHLLQSLSPAVTSHLTKIFNLSLITAAARTRDLTGPLTSGHGSAQRTLLEETTAMLCVPTDFRICVPQAGNCRLCSLRSIRRKVSLIFFPDVPPPFPPWFCFRRKKYKSRNRGLAEGTGHDIGRSMDEDSRHITRRIVHLTLEMLYLLTGEEYEPVKLCNDPAKSSLHPCLSEGERTKIPVMNTHSLVSEQKILELINKMIELLTGEVPVRCQDVAVYFSVEEWEYLEGRKDLYKDVMMENCQNLTSRGIMLEEDLSAFPFVYTREESFSFDTENFMDRDNLAHNLSPHIKKESFSCSGQSLPDGTHSDHKPHNYGTEGSSLFDSNFCDTDSCTALDHVEYTSFYIKEEPLLFPEENCSDVTLLMDHTDQDSRAHSEQSASSEGPRGTSLNDTQHHTFMKRELLACDNDILKSSDDTCKDPSYLIKESFSFNPEVPSALTNENRNRALKTEHDDLYSCSDCDKCFSIESHLHKHQKIHTNPKPSLLCFVPQFQEFALGDIDLIAQVFAKFLDKLKEIS
ncbi:unnamed protein product [Ranitomeya imitator]|uniref:C2H2-type domain-containing protein n=1 Tax=Ranitomeya imitator TaxID=111125 RepID=A0ABN9MML9_9NEOB|nr:unnamed protein product [Ranitomeya imitator]